MTATPAQLFAAEQDDGAAESLRLIAVYRLRDYERCHHADTAKARSQCGHCAALADGHNATGPLPMIED